MTRSCCSACPPDLRQLGVAAQSQSESLDLLAGVETRRVHQKRLADRRQRGLRIPHIHFADARHLGEVSDGLVARTDRLGLLTPHVQDPDPALVVPVPFIDRLQQAARLQLDLGDGHQLFEQRSGRGMVGILAEHLSQQVDRAERLPQMLHPKLGLPHPQRPPHAGVGRQLRLAPKGLLEARVVVRSVAFGVQRRQQLERRQVVGNDVEQLLRRRNRGRAVLQRVSTDLDDAAQQLALLALIEGDVDPAPVQRDQFLARLAFAQQLLQSLVGLLVGLVHVENHSQGPLGLAGAAQNVAQHRGVLEEKVTPECASLPWQRPSLRLGLRRLVGHFPEDFLVDGGHVTDTVELGAESGQLLARGPLRRVAAKQLGADP